MIYFSVNFKAKHNQHGSDFSIKSFVDLFFDVFPSSNTFSISIQNLNPSRVDPTTTSRTTVKLFYGEKSRTEIKMKGKLWNECTQNSVDDIAILILCLTQKESQARIKYVHT